MSLRRITITIPPEVLAAVESLARRDGMSVSAWLSRAAEHAAQLAEGEAAADEAIAEIGEPDDEDVAEARAILVRAARRHAQEVA